MSNTTLGNTTSNAAALGDEPIRAGGTSSFSRPAALIGGAVALVALTAIATTLAVRQPAAESGGGGAAVGALAAQTLADKPPAAGPQAAAKEEIVEKAEAKADAKADAPKAPAAKHAAAKPAPQAGTGSHAAPGAEATPAPARADERVAAVCSTCGVIEAVTPYEKKGEGTGIGAVAGGVLGGVLGHQMGGGRGKDAMTAIGVVGGGIAGHEVEKRQRATTMYAVKVRMEDGTVRTINQSSAATVGQKVTVEGQAIKSRA